MIASSYSQSQQSAETNSYQRIINDFPLIHFQSCEADEEAEVIKVDSVVQNINDFISHVNRQFTLMQLEIDQLISKGKDSDIFQSNLQSQVSMDNEYLWSVMSYLPALDSKILDIKAQTSSNYYQNFFPGQEFVRRNELTYIWDVLPKKVNRLEGWFDSLESHFRRLDLKFDCMEDRFDRMENSFVRMGDKIIDLQGRIEGLEERFEVLEGRFDRLEGRFSVLEGRFDRLEGRFEDLEERFGRLEEQVRKNTESIDRIGEQVEKNTESIRRIEEKLDRTIEKVDKNTETLEKILAIVTKLSSTTPANN